MNSKLQQAFNVVVKYGFCGDCRWNFESSNCVKHDCYENCVSVIQDALDSIDAVPVVHGHWEIDEDGNMSCSECGNAGFGRYCSYCGARMNGE